MPGGATHQGGRLIWSTPPAQLVFPYSCTADYANSEHRGPGHPGLGNQWWAAAVAPVSHIRRGEDPMTTYAVTGATGGLAAVAAPAHERCARLDIVAVVRDAAMNRASPPTASSSASHRMRILTPWRPH